MDFCTAYSLKAFPATAYAIRLYMAFLAETCSGATIANYVTAIRTFCQTNEIPCDGIKDNYTISQSIKALKHLKPSTNRRPKEAITVRHLENIFKQLDLNIRDHAGFWSMLTLGFYGLLRLGEITQHSDPRRHLTQKHIEYHPRGVILTLPASKTDQYFKGTKLFIKATYDITCPVAALKWMLKSHFGDSVPLFQTSKGIPTRGWFISFLKKVPPPSDHLSGHSLRRGGATFAASCGMTHDQIKQLGRWTSETFRIYLRNHPQLDALLRTER
jgi:integrase